MAVSDRKFSDKLFALVLINYHVLFNSTADEQIIFDNFIVFICRHDFIIISNAVIRIRLFMLIAFFVMIVFIVHRIIEAKAIHITTSASSDYMSIVK
jgi:hypothetical protein